MSDTDCDFPRGAGSDHIHVPTPGDHYSAGTGSAIMTIIYETARVHAEFGGKTFVAVSRGTQHDYPIGDCIEFDPSPLPSRWMKIADAAMGGLGFERSFGAASYAAASRAIDRNFNGTIFVHNNPVAMRLFRKEHPHAQLCLWASNKLFRTYTDRETQATVDQVDRIICCSRFIADDLCRRLSKGVEKVRVVHHGVNTEHFRADPSKRRNDPPVVLFVGRAVPWKGADLLLRAIQKIHDGRRTFKVRVVGSHGFAPSMDLTRFERKLRDLADPIKSIVEFQPSVGRSQLLEEYQAASIFCAPANWDEPFPLAILEAMACQLPTLASRRGGIPELGDHILYFTPPDIDALAERLVYLLDDASARTEWGSKGCAQAMNFSWRKQYGMLRAAIEN